MTMSRLDTPYGTATKKRRGIDDTKLIRAMTIQIPIEERQCGDVSSQDNPSFTNVRGHCAALLRRVNPLVVASEILIGLFEI